MECFVHITLCRAFSKAAEITYFIKPGFTGCGIGKAILEHLVEEGKKKGFTAIIASISSLNDGSIRFHLKNGFTQCGQLKSVGRKKGNTFDVVLCQRML